jgi:selT/selW/selH-like putative selenoprotein
MARNYHEVRKFLEHNYPSLRGHIRGENYPPPPYASYLGMVVQFLQLFFLASMFLGDAIWTYVPFGTGQPPAWYHDLKANGMAVVVFVFLIVPTLVQNLTTTGAFEIVLDEDVVLYSKLQTGRMPNGNDIIEAMARVGMTMATTAEQ